MTSETSSTRKTLEGFSRLELGAYPTPMVKLPRLGEGIGRELYVKRDDGLGPAFGGNKTRKLEYLLAEAREDGHREVATWGGLQSNHVRLTAGAARVCGLAPHALYLSPRPEHLSGNLRLVELLGATMHFVASTGLDVGAAPTHPDIANERARQLASERIGRHYFVPLGGSSWRGGLGYVQAGLEIHEQALRLGLANPRLVVAAGSGGTLAGLLAGLRLIDSPVRVLGIDIGGLWSDFRGWVASLASRICHELGSRAEFDPVDVPLVEQRYVGEGYGRPSEAGSAAIGRLARLEGLLLDPTYTAKALAGMLDLIARGELGQDEPIIFLHTGGQPALLASEPS